MRNVRWHVCKKVVYPVIAYGWEGAKRHNHIIYFLEVGFGVLRLVLVLGLALGLDVGRPVVLLLRLRGLEEVCTRSWESCW
jgi:hypothetical protein